MTTPQFFNWKATTCVIKGPIRVFRAGNRISRLSSSCIQSRALHQQTPHLQTSSSADSSGRGIGALSQRATNIFPRISPNRPQARAPHSTVTAVFQEPTIDSVFETVTGTFQYIVADPSTKTAAIIDPVLDYDPIIQAITTSSADALLALAKQKGYRIDWILETHAHADHLTAAAYLQQQLEQRQARRPSIGIGRRIDQVQQRFGKRYGVPATEYENAFDKLFDDDEVFRVGDLKATAMHLPGHTPDHLGYRIGDNVFCGDSIFHVDIGTARCDFPGGSVTHLWNSAQKLLALSEDVKIWTGHDYPPDRRTEPVPWMSVKEHKELNKHVKSGTSEGDFAAMRMERDKALAAPRLLHQSLQVNIRGGKLPGVTEGGLRLLCSPLKVKGKVW